MVGVCLSLFWEAEDQRNQMCRWNEHSRNEEHQLLDTTLNICDESVPFDQCEDIGEGGSGNFGGDNPNDSSGVLKYVRVQFGGFRINDEDELNGIAFQGVGDGTVVDFIQVHANEDDGVEFYGGTVNAKHIVLTNIKDEQKGDVLFWITWAFNKSLT